ncbi:tellurite resistance TerB family protein [Thiolapillus sp.]
MAIDAMKILGSLLNSGALSKGSGSNILGSVLGSVLGGGGSQRAGASGGIGDLLGGLLGGGGSSSSAGGMADILGGLLGGGGSGRSAGGLGDLLGAAMKQFGAAPPGMELADIEPKIEPEQANEQATIMIRAMVNAAKADGRVDHEEQRHIIEGLGDDITPEEVAFVQDELAAPLDVDAFVRSVPKGMEAQVYLASLMAIDLDTNPEAQYLHHLAQGMGLNPKEVNGLHEQLQVPKLYS